MTPRRTGLGRVSAVAANASATAAQATGLDSGAILAAGNPSFQIPVEKKRKGLTLTLGKAADFPGAPAGTGG